MPRDPKPDAETIKAKLLRYRLATGMTQRALAAQLGVSPGLIGEMERGLVRSRPVAQRVLMLEVG